MSADWELETAALAVDYRAMEVALINEDGSLTGSTMPVIPVEYTSSRLVVVIPHAYATWLPPVLFSLTDGDGESSADGNMVTGSFLVLGTSAADSLMPATGSSQWVEDGRWPLASSVMEHLTDLPAEITPRQVVMAGTRWHDGGLPATALTVGPIELEYSFQGGVSAGDWSGLLSLQWPIPEPLQEPPHDLTDVDAGEAGVLADAELGKASMAAGSRNKFSPPVKPSSAVVPTKATVPVIGKKPTTNQRLDSMHANVAHLTDQVSQLTSLLAKMHAVPTGKPGGMAPVVKEEDQSFPFQKPTGPPPAGYNPFLTTTVGQPPPGGPPPISGTPVWQAGELQMGHPPPGHQIGAGMMGPPMRNRVPQSGTSIFGPSPGPSPPVQDLRDMVSSILAEVGVAPKALPGKACSSRPDLPVSREQVKAMISEMFQNENQNLLTDGNDTDVSGARGAVAYAREKSKFENNPQLAYQDFRNKARRILGRGGNQPTTFKHLMTELPFGTMNNRKRMALLLLTMLDEVEMGNWQMVQGLMVQAMRWIVLDLENPRDPLTSWRLTFQPDPIPMQCPVRTSQGMDLNSSLLDPAQLTSTLGMARDMELLSKRLKGAKEEEGVRPNPKGGKGGGKKDKDGG